MNEMSTEIHHYPEELPRHGQTILVMRTPTNWIIAKGQFPYKENPEKYNPDYFTLWYAENGVAKGKLDVGRNSWYWVDFGEITQNLNTLEAIRKENTC